MYNPFGGNRFPYTNFHELNLDWIIEIAKNFLDQYTNIQETIDTGLEDLEAKKTELEGLLQAWYDEHSQDIADQLADALQDLNAWYTEHQNYLDDTLAANILAFDTHADEKAAQTIASIPEDYTALYNQVNNDAILTNSAYTSYASLPENYRDANNLPVNRVIGYKFGWTTEQTATMLHFPIVPFNGEILTINSTKNNLSFGFQLAINETSVSTTNNRLFFRSRYSSWSDWVEIQSPAQIMDMITGNTIKTVSAYTNYASLPETYRNANNLPVNSVIGYKFGWTTEQTATMLNFPVQPFMGEILSINTTSQAAAFGFQMAISEAAPNSDTQNRVFFRTRYQNWTSWTELTTSQNIETVLDKKAILVKDSYTSYSNLPEDYRNTNNLPINTIIGYKFGWTSEQTATMLNFPLMPFNGVIMTINTTKSNASFGVQIAVSETNPSTTSDLNRIFIRSRYAAWSPWAEITNPNYQNGAFKGLGSFVACGDSLTVSYSYINESTYVQVKSWAEHLADMIGSTCLVKAQGGITAGGFLASSLMTDATADHSDFAIVYLGTNDANQGTNAATFKSNYTDIVNNLLTNHKAVFCVPLAVNTSPSTRETYNTAIKEVCDNVTGCFMLDMYSMQAEFNRHVRNGHLNSLGYAAFAKSVAQALDLAIYLHPLMIV